jgi:8-amino-7-oxononanoate synthase
MVLGFREKLDALQSQNRFRSLKLPQGIDLTSNDYLGLREHPHLREVALHAIEGGIDMGAGGSRLLRGHTEHHEALEGFAAAHYGSERALYFANGFAANYALLTTLPSRHDVIVFDELAHASMRDGIKASDAKSIKAAHNDLNAFEEALKRARENSKGNIWVAVESVYSMDGDSAPLPALQKLAQDYDAVLIVDEAHGTGVCGAEGKGLSADLPQENLIAMHTCGKALGVAGGLVCASSEVIDYLINTSRPFIYSTAPPPLQALLTHEAIKLVAGEEGDKQRQKLLQICDYVAAKLEMESSHIVPIILGEDERAVEAAEALQAAGYDIRAIRPPTVPEGTARLRLSLNANLTEEMIADFLSHLSPLMLEKAA